LEAREGDSRRRQREGSSDRLREPLRRARRVTGPKRQVRRDHARRNERERAQGRPCKSARHEAVCEDGDQPALLECDREDGDDRARRAATRVPLRPSAGRRGGRGAAAVARAGGPDASPLARARGGRVLCRVLLRLGHALLPGPRADGPWRQDAHAARAGAVLVLARVGARAVAAPPDRHGRRVGPAAAPRAPVADAVRRRALRAAGDAGRPTPPPLGRQRLAQQSGKPQATRGGRCASPRGVVGRLPSEAVSAVPYRRTFARLLSFLRPYKRGVAVSIVLAVGSQAAQIALIWVTGRDVIDRALDDHDPHRLWIYVGAIAALGFVSAVFMLGRRLISGKQALDVEMDMRQGLYSHLVRLSFGFYDRHQT